MIVAPETARHWPTLEDAKKVRASRKAPRSPPRSPMLAARMHSPVRITGPAALAAVDEAPAASSFVSPARQAAAEASRVSVSKPVFEVGASAPTPGKPTAAEAAATREAEEQHRLLHQQQQQQRKLLLAGAVDPTAAETEVEAEVEAASAEEAAALVWGRMRDFASAHGLDRPLELFRSLDKDRSGKVGAQPRFC